MSIYALSFERVEMKGEQRTEILRFVPIGVEQIRGNYVADAIPTGNIGQIVEVNRPPSTLKTPFMIVGVNQFRSLNMDELKKWIEDKAGYGVPDSN